MRRVFLSEDSEISNHQQTQGDPVITEGFEIVLLDEAHQELDHQQGHQKGDSVTNQSILMAHPPTIAAIALKKENSAAT